MPVITLPQDTRWGDLGKGLGGLLGQAVQHYQDQQVAAGVSQLQMDPQFSDPAKLLSEVTRRFGNKGLETLTTQLKTQALRKNLNLVEAETQGARARAEHTTLETDVLGKQAPEQLAQLRAKTEAEKARTALTTAETGIVPEKGKLLAAQEGGEEARTAQGYAAAGHLAAQTDVLRQQAQSIATLQGPGVIEKQLSDAGIEDPKGEKASYLRGEVASGGITGYKTALATLQRQKEVLEKPTDLTPETRKSITSAAALAPSLAPFLEPIKPGTPAGFGAGISDWLTKHGLGGDPDIMARSTAATQSMAHFAEAGSGFGGAWRVALAKDIVPQINRTPVYSVLETGQIAKGMVETLKSQLEQNKVIKGRNTKAIEDQLATYQGMLDKANTLWWGQPAVGADKKPTGPTQFYYQGNQVDPKTLQIIRPNAEFPATKVYKDVYGQTHTGAEINEAARRLGLDPQTGAQRMGIVP